MAAKKDESKEAMKWESFSNKKPSKIYELQLIQQKELRYVRQNKKWIIFDGNLSKIHNDNDNKRLYYRHMNQQQFDYLLNNNKVDLVDKNAYVAITTNHGYCIKYLNNQKRNGTDNTHIVEFKIEKETNLEQLFKMEAMTKLNVKKLKPKIEDGAWSWGLGPQCRKGILGNVFNQLLNENKITFRLLPRPFVLVHFTTLSIQYMLQCNLTVNTKVDVFNPLINNGSWCIGTIKSNINNESIEIQVDATDTLLRISDTIERRLRYLRCEDIRSEWDFLRLRDINESVASLNTHTFNHYYLHNPSVPICIQSKQFNMCSQCDTKCCSICNLCEVNGDLYCGRCVSIDIKHHNIQESIDLFCCICRSWLTRDTKYECTRCHKIYCNQCGLKRDKLCKKCEIDCKQKKYAKSIKTAIGYDVGYDITNLITSFCLGHIVYCGNLECCNTISINNQTELENGIDSERNKIYQYKVRRVFAAAFYDDSTCYLYGKLRRVFCAECTETKLKRCIWASLSYYRAEHNELICEHYDVTECCKNHAYCGLEQRYWKYARDADHHRAPRCHYDKELWLYTEGRKRLCKWCSVTKHLFRDSYYDYDDYDDYYDYYDYYDWYSCYMDDSNGDTAKQYGINKERHRKRNMYFDRDMMKNSKYNRKVGLTVKKTQKRKSYIKRRKDRKGSYESKVRFKKRYQLSLQY